MRILLLTVLCGALFVAAAHAQTTGDDGARAGPLTADEVLESSARHFPAILSAMAERRAAAGDLEAARGAFDLVFETEARQFATGFYRGSTTANATVTKPIAPLGAEIFGGYRISNGELPIYYDEYFTNQAGEGRIGVLFSLLRDRDIDGRRFGVNDAVLALRAAELELLMTKIGVQHRALTTYLRWVWAGRRLSVYQNLLAIAEARQEGLSEQVRAGAVARIFLTENQQNIARRQRLAAEAERDLVIAANALSFYYRDSAGEPATVSPDFLPENAAGLTLRETPNLAQAAPAIIDQRPELKVLRTAIERARAKVDVRENDLKPRLDLSAELSRDIGAIAEGGVSRDSTDGIIGLRFTVPLQRREARGRLERAEAELEKALQERRRIEDRLTIELQDIVVSLETARRLVAITTAEFEQAQVLQDAERTRFENGASDFFLVNVREETAADARIRAFGAALDAALAEANYDAATLNLDRFLIEE